MPPTNFPSKNAEYVDDLIKSNRIVIFSATYCPYCSKAKKLLESLNENNFSLEVDTLGIFIDFYLNLLKFIDFIYIRKW